MLFVVPNLDMVLRPLEGDSDGRSFSGKAMGRQISPRWFNEAIGKRWC